MTANNIIAFAMDVGYTSEIIDGAVHVTGYGKAFAMWKHEMVELGAVYLGAARCQVFPMGTPVHQRFRTYTFKA